MATLDSRKPVFDLDAEGVPGQDETWVKPIDGDRTPEHGFFGVVAAEFRAPNGTLYAGCMNVYHGVTHDAAGSEMKVEISPGATLADGVQGEIPDGVLDVLEFRHRDVFPLAWRLKACISWETDPRAGTILS
ncbi:MAG: hypothetical protein HYY93_05915 [Planctomycetes bacterium]|nr:hypothetical protein [Planctomycetota bacterium]